MSVRGRRGSTEYGAQKLVDVVLSILVILGIVMLSVAVWNSLYGVDKKARNEFRLAADLIQSLIDEERADQGLHERTLTIGGADFSPSAREAAYKGSFFGIYDDGQGGYQFTHAQPYTGPGDSTLTNMVGSGELRAAHNTLGVDPWVDECEMTPCLCFSRATGTRGTRTEAAEAVMNGITECRIFRLDDDIGRKTLFMHVPDYSRFAGNFAAAESNEEPVELRLIRYDRGQQVTGSGPCDRDICISFAWEHSSLQ